MFDTITLNESSKRDDIEFEFKFIIAKEFKSRNVPFFISKIIILLFLNFLNFIVYHSSKYFIMLYTSTHTYINSYIYIQIMYLKSFVHVCIHIFQRTCKIRDHELRNSLTYDLSDKTSTIYIT